SLGPYERTGAQVHARLVVEQEFLISNCLLKFVCQALPLNGAALVDSIELLDFAKPRAPRVMKCGSRLAEQGYGIVASLPDHEAGREPDFDGSARKRKPLAQCDLNSVQPGHSLFASVHDACDGKLVASGPRDQVRAKSLQPLCRLLQKSVADAESIACIYVLELRNVDRD